MWDWGTGQLPGLCSLPRGRVARFRGKKTPSYILISDKLIFLVHVYPMQYLVGNYAKVFLVYLDFKPLRDQASCFLWSLNVMMHIY